MDNTFLAQFYGKSQNYTDIPNHLYKDYNVKTNKRKRKMIPQILTIVSRSILRVGPQGKREIMVI